MLLESEKSIDIIMQNTIREGFPKNRVEEKEEIEVEEKQELVEEVTKVYDGPLVSPEAKIDFICAKLKFFKEKKKQVVNVLVEEKKIPANIVNVPQETTINVLSTIVESPKEEIFEIQKYVDLLLSSFEQKNKETMCMLFARRLKFFIFPTKRDYVLAQFVVEFSFTLSWSLLDVLWKVVKVVIFRRVIFFHYADEEVHCHSCTRGLAIFKKWDLM